MSCIMHLDSDFWQVDAHRPAGHDGSSPRLVVPGEMLDSGFVSREEAGVREALVSLQGGNSLPINAVSYRAFLDHSGLVRELVDFVKSIGIEVYLLGDLRRDLSLFRKAHLDHTGAVEEAIRSSLPWARDYLRACLQSWLEAMAQGQRMLVDSNVLVAFVLVAARRHALTIESWRPSMASSEPVHLLRLLHASIHEALGRVAGSDPETDPDAETDPGPDPECDLRASRSTP